MSSQTSSTGQTGVLHLPSLAPGNKAGNWANSPLCREPFLCWFVSEFWLLLFQSEPWSSLCLGVHCIFPRTQLRNEQLVSFLSSTAKVTSLTLKKDVSCSFLLPELTAVMPLAGKEPSLGATMCCSITNAILKRVDVGSLQIKWGAIQAGKIFVCQTPHRKKSFFKWKLM